ncbi:hypothetical protein NP493_42g02001 [Ridgeia piscesae]|uniref:Uncharacterized protein n=1 Tax=Ridgeia piscesae TaxID=27915 RepID=A0AAD9PCA9_RIDPI|nr:hypothetical protein NP493_42g02001 [Ridgeia piscesae]
MLNNIRNRRVATVCSARCSHLKQQHLRPATGVWRCIPVVYTRDTHACARTAGERLRCLYSELLKRSPSGVSGVDSSFRAGSVCVRRRVDAGVFTSRPAAEFDQAFVYCINARMAKTHARPVATPGGRASVHETLHRESERRRNVRRLSVSSRPLSDRVSPIDGVAMASNLSRAV